jgi:acyl carrier protein
MTPTIATSGAFPPPGELDAVTCTVRKHLLALLSESNPQAAITLDDDASFDSLGLDSISRVGLVERIAQEYNLDLDITAAYDFITVQALARFVHASDAGHKFISVEQ